MIDAYSLTGDLSFFSSLLEVVGDDSPTPNRGYVISYMCYLVLCLKDPHQALGMAEGENIDIVNVATNANQANKVFFAKLTARIKKPYLESLAIAFSKKRVPELDVMLRVAKLWKELNAMPLGSQSADIEYVLLTLDSILHHTLHIYFRGGLPSDSRITLAKKRLHCFMYMLTKKLR